MRIRFCDAGTQKLAGICPGPALVLLPTGHWQAWVFVIAMLAGMLMFKALQTRR